MGIYHLQDTERAVEGGAIYLNFGAFAHGQENEFEIYQNDSIRIAQRIVAALQKASLQPDWDGTFERRVYSPLQWQKRRNS